MPTIQFKGKSVVKNHHLTVPYHELIPIQEKSMTPEVRLDDNLIIQGDNLIALKALLPIYAGKIKCIYIDPPYNIGNEKWVYNDNVNSPMIREWLGQIVDKDDLTRHDKWLCMMMPRLNLLRELMSDDGVIFVSIDNNEVHRLKLLMDEVFGESNFISCIAHVNNPKGRSDDKHFATAHDYLLVYKKKDEPVFYGWKPEENVLRRYRLTDENGQKYREIDLRKTGDNDRREDRENLFYYFYYNQETGDFFASKEKRELEGYIEIIPLRNDGTEGNWRWECDTANQNIHLLIPKIMSRRRIWTVFEKDYLKPDERVKPTTAWTKKAFNSERGTEQFLELGFKKEDFNRPKPVGTIRHIIEMATKGDDIILDAFAGSGTTGQAVLEQNKEDGTNRRFILIEMENFADTITAERIRRVIKGVPSAKSEVLKQGTGGTFSFFQLGKAININGLLIGDNLPSYMELARYVFYTATGEAFDPSEVNESRFYIGSSSKFDVYLVYKPDLAFLKTAAINLEFAEGLGSYQGKKRLVFAPMKYLDEYYLEKYHIDFAQLPYEIFRFKG
mgnify:CR=1 FL=1